MGGGRTAGCGKACAAMRGRLPATVSSMRRRGRWCRGSPLRVSGFRLARSGHRLRAGDRGAAAEAGAVRWRHSTAGDAGYPCRAVADSRGRVEHRRVGAVLLVLPLAALPRRQLLPTGNLHRPDHNLARFVSVGPSRRGAGGATGRVALGADAGLSSTARQRGHPEVRRAAWGTGGGGFAGAIQHVATMARADLRFGQRPPRHQAATPSRTRSAALETAASAASAAGPPRDNPASGAAPERAAGRYAHDAPAWPDRIPAVVASGPATPAESHAAPCRPRASATPPARRPPTALHATSEKPARCAAVV